MQVLRGRCGFNTVAVEEMPVEIAENVQLQAVSLNDQECEENGDRPCDTFNKPDFNEDEAFQN